MSWQIALKPISTFTVINWLLAVGWTLILCYLMLAPGTNSAADDVSTAFGGTDMSDAAGHVALTFIETLLLTNVLRLYFPLRRSLIIAAGFTLALGVSFELAQHWIPDRGGSALDIGANALGVALCAAVLYWNAARIHHSANV